MEKITEACGISINKNTVASDVSAMSPSGVRLGTASLTTRGFTNEDFVDVADFLHECCQLAAEITSKVNKNKFSGYFFLYVLMYVEIIWNSTDVLRVLMVVFSL